MSEPVAACVCQMMERVCHSVYQVQGSDLKLREFRHNTEEPLHACRAHEAIKHTNSRSHCGLATFRLVPACGRSRVLGQFLSSDHVECSGLLNH